MTRDDRPLWLTAGIEARVCGMLQISQRRPHAAARVLALIVQLKPGVAFLSDEPGHLKRDDIANYLDISAIALDKVLDRYRRSGMLKKRVRSVAGRNGRVMRRTYYDPSPELRGLIEPLLC